MVALALARDPGLLAADEPTASLDAPAQVESLDLLDRLRRERGLALLIISHDPGVAAVAERLAVMVAGRVVEAAKRDDLLRSPLHPYTRLLLGSLPGPAWRSALGREAVAAERVTRTGCPFAPRCDQVRPRCQEAEPPPTLIGEGRTLRCWIHAG